MRLGRRALLAGLAGLAMPNPTEARLALRAAAAGARDRLANRQDAIVGLAGDGNGNVTVAGTGLMLVRTLTGGRVLLAHNPSGRAWVEGEIVEAIPLDDRAPLGYRVAGTRPHILYAELIASYTTTYNNPQRADEPWQINTATGAMVPIGSYLLPTGMPEPIKLTLVNNWIPLWKQHELVRVHDGVLSWRRDELSTSADDGGQVRLFVQYVPGAGWLTYEPNLRRVMPDAFSNMFDNGRVGAIDVDDFGNVYLIDTFASVVTNLGIVATWRKTVIDDTLRLWNGQTDFQVWTSGELLDIANIDTGIGADGAVSWAFNQIVGSPRYANVLPALGSIADAASEGIASNAMFLSEAATVPLHGRAWRTSAGAYRIATTGTSTADIRLYFAAVGGGWNIVGSFLDAAPFIAVYTMEPYLAGGFWVATETGLAGTNPNNAANYYGPASVASGDTVTTIWHTIIMATTTIKRAVVSVVEDVSPQEYGRIMDCTTSSGKMYFTTGAFLTSNHGSGGAQSREYTNTYIDPGIWEVDPITYGVRQVCGMPPGWMPGGWHAIWGDRRSEAT